MAYNLNLADHLLNGALILSRYRYSPTRWTVLCVFEGGYVTWCADEKGNAYWGHYFRAHHCAKHDYQERIKRCERAT